MADQSIGPFGKQIRILGKIQAHFLGMFAVVQADADDSPGVGNDLQVGNIAQSVIGRHAIQGRRLVLAAAFQQRP